MRRPWDRHPYTWAYGMGDQRYPIPLPRLTTLCRSGGGQKKKMPAGGANRRAGYNQVVDGGVTSTPKTWQTIDQESLRVQSNT